jgi:hypothetical protein
MNMNRPDHQERWRVLSRGEIHVVILEHVKDIEHLYNATALDRVLDFLDFKKFKLTSNMMAWPTRRIWLMDLMAYEMWRSEHS